MKNSNIFVKTDPSAILTFIVFELSWLNWNENAPRWIVMQYKLEWNYSKQTKQD